MRDERGDANLNFTFALKYLHMVCELTKSYYCYKTLSKLNFEKVSPVDLRSQATSNFKSRGYMQFLGLYSAHLNLSLPTQQADPRAPA